MVLEYASEDGKEGVVHEILEQEGLALGYTTSTTGYRRVTLYPATEVQRLIKQLRQLGQELEERKLGKIIRQFLAEIDSSKEVQDEKIEDIRSQEVIS